jgi:hypothetical protein
MARLTEKIRTEQRALGRVGLPEAARVLGRSHTWLWRHLRGSSGLVYDEHGAKWVNVETVREWLAAAGVR